VLACKQAFEWCKFEWRHPSRNWSSGRTDQIVSQIIILPDGVTLPLKILQTWFNLNLKYSALGLT